MVSNSLSMDLETLLATLKKIKREYGNTEEFKNWRKQVPKDWPI